MRIGLLGAARISPPALVDPSRVRPGAVLQVVAARERVRAEAFAATHGIARVADDYAAVVGADDVDLVYNALPIHLHAEWSIAALKAGKHVLCEKPFAMNGDEARAVLEAARASGKRVIEAFHYRYHPGFGQLLSWVHGGAIGAVTSIEAKFNVAIPDKDGLEIRHLPETGGGAFMDLGCYPLSWALMVMGSSPTGVSAEATLTSRGVDESMRAELRFEGGAVARLQASMAMDQAFAAELRVVGVRGTIHFVNPLAPHYGSRLTMTRDGEVETARVSRLATYAYQLDAVLAGLENGDALPTEGEAVLRQQEALDAVYQAAGLRALRFRGA